MNFDIHESVYIDKFVEIGKNTQIWRYSTILSGSRIGKNCRIGQNVVIGPDVIIGDNCKIQNNVSIFKGVTLEDNVFCGPSMVFTNVYNPRAEISKMDEARPTLVKTGCTIGANATIVCGNTLGRYSFIGAGAVVTKNVPDYILAIGNPAKFVKFVCECGEPLQQWVFGITSLQCYKCGKTYREKSNGQPGIERKV